MKRRDPKKVNITNKAVTIKFQVFNQIKLYNLRFPATKCDHICRVTI